MSFQKIMAIFLLITLVGRTAIAEDKAPEFTRVAEGQTAPFTGYLFTPAAIVKVINKGEEDKNKAVAECETETANVRLDLSRETELRTVETASSKRLLRDLTESKERAIEERNKRISLLESDKVFSNVLIVGSFLAGAALTTGIIYITSGVIK